MELFFKWIKQHLRIKSFYGTSENAVKTQIWIAVSIYVLIDTGWAGVLSNWALIAGYICLAANTALLVLALRDGQLSVLYPIIALTYVWVTILSPMFFNDVINAYKVIGVGLIVVGVSFIGLGSRS